MPIYEYECNTCECKFEELVYNTNDSNVVCPKCKEKNIKKIMSVFSHSSSSPSMEASKMVAPPSGPTARVPIYTDRNSGRQFTGAPEIVNIP